MYKRLPFTAAGTQILRLSGKKVNGLISCDGSFLIKFMSGDEILFPINQVMDISDNPFDVSEIESIQAFSVGACSITLRMV